MNIPETIHEALQYWASKHAESSVRCQSCYFYALRKTAEENGFAAPCQQLYDCYVNSATTKGARFSRRQVVKKVDMVAQTHAVTPEGSFYNEPPFPTESESNAMQPLFC